MQDGYDIANLRKSFDNKKGIVGFYNTITNPIPNFN